MNNIQEMIDEWLDIDPEKGEIRWKKSKGSRTKKGEEAGSITVKGYKIINFNGKYYYVHRLIWFFVHGYFPENYIDHINGDKIDNRICNLREVSQSCNLQNSKPRKNNTSGFHGVSKGKGRKKYYAQIVIKGKTINLGSYINKLEAAYARAAYEILNPEWKCNVQGNIFKQIACYDKTFDYERFKKDVEKYGFEFSNQNLKGINT